MRSVLRRQLWITVIILGIVSTLMAPSARSQGQSAEGDQPKVQQTQTKDHKWALVIGIGKFKDHGLNRASGAYDAESFYRYLLTEGNFAKDHVRLLLNEHATKDYIFQQIGTWLPAVAKPGDLVVVFLSTHATPANQDKSGINYALAYNTDKSNLAATGIVIKDLGDFMRSRLPSTRNLLVIDSGHAGAATIGTKKSPQGQSSPEVNVPEGTGQVIIASGGANELSWQSKTGNTSVFTTRLLEGLRLHGAQTSLTDAFTYTKEKVQQDVSRDRGQAQTPILKSRWQGKDIILAE
jgi:hypothetical protein